ncbi:hypothetical protein V6U77_07810 [Micromonospora sp. CPCC 205546]|uniref:hypothetical protein n=1 Tax=Micromonospora sp. CPCC 205546 TaxID=3122397 RepID=UPI002FF08744
MIDLDERIVRTLRERAGGTVDTDRLTARAVALGRARRRRRRIGAASALGVVALLGSAAVGALGPVPGPRWPGAEPTVAVAAPARVPGVPGAAARPDLVGNDPQLLHFTVDPARARWLTWQSIAGAEGARLDLGGGRQVAFDLARTVTAVEDMRHEGMTYPAASAGADAFDGQVRQVPSPGPGAQPGWFLRWQPVPGLYARVYTVADDDSVLRAAQSALRLDAAHRCASPLRLGALPPDAWLAGCAVNAVGFPDSLDVVLRVARPGGRWMQVRLEHHREMAGSRAEGNRTIGDRAAYLYPKGDELELLGFRKAHLTARFGWPSHGFTEADAAVVLGGSRVAADLADPRTWD